MPGEADREQSKTPIAGRQALYRAQIGKRRQATLWMAGNALAFLTGSMTKAIAAADRALSELDATSDDHWQALKTICLTYLADRVKNGGDPFASNHHFDALILDLLATAQAQLPDDSPQEAEEVAVTVDAGGDTESKPESAFSISIGAGSDLSAPATAATAATAAETTGPVGGSDRDINDREIEMLFHIANDRIIYKSNLEKNSRAGMLLDAAIGRASFAETHLERIAQREEAVGAGTPEVAAGEATVGSAGTQREGLIAAAQKRLKLTPEEIAAYANIVAVANSTTLNEESVLSLNACLRSMKDMARYMDYSTTLFATREIDKREFCARSLQVGQCVRRLYPDIFKKSPSGSGKASTAGAPKVASSAEVHAFRSMVRTHDARKDVYPTTYALKAVLDGCNGNKSSEESVKQLNAFLAKSDNATRLQQEYVAALTDANKSQGAAIIDLFTSFSRELGEISKSERVAAVFREQLNKHLKGDDYHFLTRHAAGAVRAKKNKQYAKAHLKRVTRIRDLTPDAAQEKVKALKLSLQTARDEYVNDRSWRVAARVMFGVQMCSTGMARAQKILDNTGMSASAKVAAMADNLERRKSKGHQWRSKKADAFYKDASKKVQGDYTAKKSNKAAEDSKKSKKKGKSKAKSGPSSRSH